MYKKLTILLLFLIMPFVNQAQDSFLKDISLNTHYGFIYAHDKDVENTDGSRPFGISLEYSILKFDSASFNIARCYPKSGISLIYFNYDNPVLGHSLTCAYFIEPSFALSDRFFFAPRGSVGLTWLSNPYDPVRNPGNNSYSLPVSVFLQAGLALNYRFSQKANVHASANYLHISNGGVKNPNKGINWPTASVGFSYRINEANFQKQKYQPARRFRTYNRFDAGIYSSGKTDQREGNALHLVPGIFVGYQRRLNNLHSIGLVADLHLDYALAKKQKSLNEKEYFYFPSLAASHEYLIGKFIFWQQVGFYVITPDERFNRWYHRWGLNYSLTENFSIGTSLKAHAQVAHFADLRLTYNLKY